jgi:glycosyltransferase involved in cell wall biosynthesis
MNQLLSVLFVDHFNRHCGARECIIDIAKELQKRNAKVIIPQKSIAKLKAQAFSLPSLNFPLFLYKCLLESPSLKTSMGKAGRKRFQSEFSIEKTCNDLVNYYATYSCV